MTPLFQLAYADGWDKHFAKFDKPAQDRIRKKITRLKTLENARHLKHGLPVFVVETGQYRICFGQEGSVRTVLFAGAHKHYEEWLRQQ